MDVIIPALGESVTEATVGQWLKAVGEQVAADEPIVSLETDKVAVEVNAPGEGVLTEQLFAEGDTVEVGAVIARLGDKAGASAAAPEAKADAGEAPEPAGKRPSFGGESMDRDSAGAAAATPGAPADEGDAGPGEAAPSTGPAARRRAMEGGQRAPAQAPPSTPALQAAGSPDDREAGERREERVRMTRLRQTIARRLKEAQDTAALLTTFNDVDMTAVIEARQRYRESFEKKHGVRLGFMSFFVKACALAARDVPAVNARIEGDEIVFHHYFDVGVAVSGPNGLVVPILRDAHSRSFADIELGIADFGRRARDGTLKLDELQGGTFTISNGGVFGSLMSTPIINPPQSAVLGMHRIEQRPVVRDGAIVIRPMMYLALSYDHRLIDGREAVTFLVTVKDALEDPMRLLVDL